MGIVSALVALLRAVPSLERLFLKVHDQLREAKAQRRYNEKLDKIDTAIANARGGGLSDSRVSGTDWSLDVDRTPAVSSGGTVRARVDEGSVEESGRTGV
mgnify:FL=1|tara:strand:+ start:420 stop:719 length:300 start_codon:yes stop_codon:yes gene_type:complete